MKNLFLFLFLFTVTFSILDTSDPKKVLLLIEQENGVTDKLILERSKLSCHTCIISAVEQILNYREKIQGDK